MRRRVNPARTAAYHRHADISQLIRQLARGFDAVMRRHPRTDHCHSIFVLGRQRALDIKDEWRVVNFPQRRGIFLVALNQNMAAELLNAFQFTRKVNGFFPAGNRPGGFITDVADAEQFTFGRLKNFGRVAEMFEQQPGAHRADVFDEIERDERLSRVHARIKGVQAPGFKFQVPAN